MLQVFDHDFFQKLVDKMNTGVYITDVETYEIVYMNSYLKEQFQLEEKPGQICFKVLQSNMDEPCPFCKIKQLKEMGEDNFLVWKEHNTATGNVYLNHDCLQTWNGRLYHIQSSIDITEQIELSIAASYDELTGILNRNAGKKQMEIVLQQLSNHEYFTVALCDVNGLKWVNDTLGHLEGDRLLVFLSKNISESLENDDFIFRLSGDEFVVVFKNKTEAEADAAMQQILKDLDERKQKNGITYEVSFSYGLSCIHGDAHLSVSDVLLIADTQMYIQKRDYHSLKGKLNTARSFENILSASVRYQRNDLFDAMCDSVDDYPFIGNLKTGEFLYSPKMMMDFGLPGQLIQDAANFWGERIHPEDVDLFLKSNREMAAGQSERHAVTYRAKDANGNWVGLLCKGKLIRDAHGVPDLFAGVIRNLSRHGEAMSQYSKTTRLFQNYTSSSFFLGQEGRSVPANRDSKPSLIKGKRFFEHFGRHYEEEFLNMVSSDLPCGILLLRDQEDYPIIYFNQSLVDYSGCSLDEFIKEYHSYRDLIIEEDRQNVFQEKEAQLAHNTFYEVRYRMLNKEGKLRWLYERGKCISDKAGEKFIVSFIADITRDMTFDEELRYITQHSDSGIFKAEMSEGFPLIYVNDGYCRIHGYTRAQLSEELHNLALPLVLEEDIADVQNYINACILENRKHIALKYRIRKRNQEIAWLYVDATLITPQNGPLIMIGMIMDITAQKNLENKVQRAERLYSFAREQSKISMWEYDINNHVIYQNEDVPGLQGFDTVIPNVPEFMISHEYFHEDFVEIVRTAYQKLHDGAEKVSFICKSRIPDKPDAYMWRRVSYTLVKNDREGRWAIGCSEDITEWKESQQKIYDGAREQLPNIEDLLVCYEIDIIKNELLNVWTADFITPTTIPLHQGTYEEIFEEINSYIATRSDQKRFAKEYSWDRLTQHFQDETLPKDFEFRMQRSTGAIIWSVIQFRIITAPENDHPILFLYLKDIDLRKKNELDFRQKVDVDELTGFYQPVSAKGMIENLLDQPDYFDCALAMLMVDTNKLEDNNLAFVHKNISMHLPKNVIACREDNDRYMLFFYDYSDYSAPPDILNQILEDMQKAQCFAAAGLCYRRTSAGFAQLREAALYALDNAVKKGNGSLSIYRDVHHSRDIERCIEVDSLEQLRDQIDKCWDAVERGTNRKETFTFLLKILNSFYGGLRSCLIPMNRTLPELSYQVAGYEAPLTNYDDRIFMDLFNSGKQDYLIVEDETSLGYETLVHYYQKPPLPCIMGAIFEDNRLQGVLLIEAACKNLRSLQAICCVCNFYHRSNAIVELQNSCQYARTHDSITGLLNYDSYIRYANNVNEDIFSTFGMIGIYITNFKQYNKTYGVKQGNLLLQNISDILCSCFPKDHCFRLSGANLLITCPDVSYDSFLERLQEAEDKIKECCGNQIILAQVWEGNVISLEIMQQQLQEKIKIASSSLRNAQTNEIVVSTMLQSIQEEMEAGRYLIYLQPKLTADTLEVCGAEALIRYQHPEKGIIPPGVFLPAIERAGLIHHIDLFVLEEVCRQLVAWKKQGYDGVPISLNYSRATILQPNVLETTIEITERYQIPRSMIEIEITESISSVDHATLAQIVRGFREAGFAISIDDFGAEYSNIYMLYALDIAALKFDRRIINDIDHDERAKTVVKHIIELCAQMKITTVAEGVETVEQSNILRELCCDRMQGYFINKPLHCEEFTMRYIK